MNTSLLRARLLGLSAYRNILRLPVIEKLADCLTLIGKEKGEKAVEAYQDAYYLLCEGGFTSLADYLEEHVRYDSAPYPELVAAGSTDENLASAARQDIETLNALAAVSGAKWSEMLHAILPDCWSTVQLPCWKSREKALDFKELTGFYRVNGAGLFSKYRAFKWQDRKLHPIPNPDFVPADQLVGYTIQRQQVYDNTASLVAGNQANNVLLYGESGTGKSATVKSMLGVPEFESLRLIEMEKSELDGIPALVRMLGHRPQKFILYIDDLAFDKDDRTYSQLKTILEGGLEPKPANVAIYATSNRRHLVRETFTDRLGDEVDATETISEKTSLSERFGIRVAYLTLDQEKFLNLCYELSARAGVTMPREQQKALAMRWSIRHPGRTPRVALQFVNSLVAAEKK